jgi:uncharacterized circularly permuted ATP-grasp superfamily protein
MVAFDVVQRWLRHSGLKVTYVRNVTDIDDKIIRRATENGESIRALTDRMMAALHQDADALGIERPTLEPRATDYVPQMIEFYLGEKPILNNVPTFQCRKPDDLAYTLAHLKDLVLKEVHGAGGYGMLVGPAASSAEIENFRQALLANPSGYIAQPTLSLSTCPTYVESGIAPRHIDLRPYVLSGKTVQMVPGGLTRVALQEGSLVVNSSQGGGTKDTWILED